MQCQYDSFFWTEVCKHLLHSCFQRILTLDGDLECNLIASGASSVTLEEFENSKMASHIKKMTTLSLDFWPLGMKMCKYCFA